jgi:phospholipid/cholesterol/gamma-HCH transport system substrate-binding protein
MKSELSNVAWLTRLVVVGLVVAVIGAVAGWVVVSRTHLVRTDIGTPRYKVCAEFSDAVGVYVGNTVSLMGVPVGTVESIEPRPGGVRMSMNVDATVSLPSDVGAVVIDNSIVTDRRVEFSKPYTTGAKLARGNCIPQARTKTPRGVSASFTATAKLLSDALGDDAQSIPGKKRTDDLAEIGAALDQTVSGRGADFNKLMSQFVQMMGDAPETDAILRRLLENSNTLTTQANQSWPDVRTTVDTMTASIKAFTAFSEEFAGTLDRGAHAVPILARFFGNYGTRIVALLKYIGPWINTLAPYATQIGEIVARLPGLATVTDQIFDSRTGALRVMWKPPAVDLRGQDTAGVCAALGRPQGCIVDSSSVGLVQLLVGSGK